MSRKATRISKHFSGEIGLRAVVEMLEGFDHPVEAVALGNKKGEDVVGGHLREV